MVLLTLTGNDDKRRGDDGYRQRGKLPRRASSCKTPPIRVCWHADARACTVHCSSGGAPVEGFLRRTPLLRPQHTWRAGRSLALGTALSERRKKRWFARLHTLVWQGSSSPSPSGNSVWIELQFRLFGLRHSMWEWHRVATGKASRLRAMSQLRQSSEAIALRFTHSALEQMRAARRSSLREYLCCRSRSSRSSRCVS